MQWKCYYKKNLKFYRGWTIFLRQSFSFPSQKQGSGPDDPPAPKRDARAHVDDERPRGSCAAVVRGKWVIVRILEAMNRESDSDLSFYMQSYIYWEISSLKIKLKMVENEENVKWKLRDGSHEKEGVRSWHHRGKWWFYVGINEFKLKGGMWSMDVGLWTEK